MENTEIEKLVDIVIDERPNNFGESLERILKGESLVMFYLYKHTDHFVNAGEIARALDVSTARIATALNSLEKKDYIHKFKDKHDFRVTIVALTQSGREEIERKRNLIIQKIIRIANAIGEDDLREFLRISLKIKELIRQEI